MVEIAKALRPLEEEKAKERQGARTDLEHCGKLPQSKEETKVKGKTRDKVAKAMGTSGRTLEKMEELVDAAKKEPEKYKPLVEKMDKTGKVDGA